MPLLLMKLVFVSLGKPPMPFGLRTLGGALGQGVQNAYLNPQLETHARFIAAHLAERPWFAHTDAALTERGTQGCPYVHPAADEIQLIRKLRRYVPNAKPVVSHADQCTSEYHAYGDEEVICS